MMSDEQAVRPSGQRKQAQQTMTLAQRKAEWMAAAEAAFDALLQWEAQAVKPNLTALEDQVLAVRQQLGVEMAESLLAHQAAQAAAEMTVEPVQCPTCGAALETKGERRKVFTTRLGELESERPYTYCPTCKRGVFPPGRPT